MGRASPITVTHPADGDEMGPFPKPLGPFPTPDPRKKRNHASLESARIIRSSVCRERWPSLIPIALFFVEIRVIPGSFLSVRAYMLAVVYIASIATLYKIGVWAIRTYHP